MRARNGLRFCDRKLFGCRRGPWCTVAAGVRKGGEVRSSGEVTVGGEAAGQEASAGKQGRTTLAAIAAEAGVSLPTVSKVVNGRPDVAPATRAKVERLL